jgi:hypothetical protein
MNFWNCINLGTPAGVGKDTVHLPVLPLFHTGGLKGNPNPLLQAGGTVVLMRMFDPGDALRVIGNPAAQITHFCGVAAPYQLMLQHPDLPTTDLSRAGNPGPPTSLCCTPRRAWSTTWAAIAGLIRSARCRWPASTSPPATGGGPTPPPVPSKAAG